MLTCSAMSRWRRALDRLGPTVRSAVHLRPSQLIAFARQRSSGPARIPLQSRTPGCDAVTVVEGFVGPSPEGALDDDGVRLVGHAPHDPLRFGWEGGDDPLWAYTLHYHGWLSHPSCDLEVGRTTMLDWIEEHRQGVGWEPYPTSLRLLHWIGWLGKHNASLHASALETILASVCAQMQHLEMHQEVHLDGNHLWTNCAALAAAAFAFDGAVPRRMRRNALTRLWAVVSDQLLADGVHGERTPSYHCLLAEQLALVVALAAPAAPGLVDPLRRAFERMCDATVAFTHPDGDVALWGDSQLGGVVTPRRLVTRRGIEAPTGDATAPSAGFARRTWGAFTLLWNQGGLGLPYQVGHIHADCGAIELSIADTRVLVDAGVGTYVDGDDRRYSRSTRAHNTVEVDGRDQHELWMSHRIGGRAELDDLELAGDRLAVRIAGYGTDARHSRIVSRDGDAIAITDSIDPPIRATVRYHVPATLRVRPVDGGALIFVPRGPTVELSWSTGPVTIEAVPGWTAMGVPAERTCISAPLGARGTMTIRALR